ncbi:MAG: hypothetical protein GWN00_16455, partial [Aliifodinibius sp.]|nr:hypothetical protein [Fodinibius sp.]NIV12623.1 hypothetical protein [Fodinibius sp.]NIY26337.1 hypothetical protein [Fodinibius sp.]
WSAIQQQDEGAARIFIAKDTINKNEITENILPINQFTVGRTVIDGNNAWVDTEVELAGDEPFTVPLKTVLLRENETW